MTTLRDIHEQSLITQLGIGALPQEAKVQLLESAAELIEIRFVESIVEKLPEAAAKEVVRLLEAKDEDAAKKLLAEHAVDINAVYVEVIAEVRSQMQSAADKAEKEITTDSLSQIGTVVE